MTPTEALDALVAEAWSSRDRPGIMIGEAEAIVRAALSTHTAQAAEPESHLAKWTRVIEQSWPSPARQPATHTAQPLTDEQINAIRQLPQCWTGPGLGASFKHDVFAREVEKAVRAHGIGTPAQQAEAPNVRANRPSGAAQE